MELLNGMVDGLGENLWPLGQMRAQRGWQCAVTYSGSGQVGSFGNCSEGKELVKSGGR